MTKSDNRALARSDRVTIAHSLHCALAHGREKDAETFRVMAWAVRLYGMHNISQEPRSLPIGVWRAMYKIFGDDLRNGGDRLWLALTARFESKMHVRPLLLQSRGF